MKIIECVPNVSEGRDHAVLEQLSAVVHGIDGVELLDVDPGADTNRTVFTFVGDPDSLAQAAFAFAKRANELIDMQNHTGAHSRMGAVDVMPFVPVGGGATMDDCVELANRVGRRIGEELAYPVYLYENAATKESRRSLAELRRGEYEALDGRFDDPEQSPDYGPAKFVPRSGATAVGAREFLIAYNVNLNTTDKKRAHNIALDIREQGRFLRDAQRKIVRNHAGEKQRKPGKHQNVRAVGWYIDEFGQAQVSINLTNYKVTPPHVIFDSICEEAEKRGLRVTGSEIVGLIPLDAMLMAGRHYASKQGLTTGLPEPDLVDLAKVSLGLDDVKPFDPQQAIIDYRLTPRSSGLRSMSLTDFADELSRSSPAPGGGSVAALAGALGASLTSMVAALTKDPERAETMKALGDESQALKDHLLRTVDRDSAAFDAIGTARRLPRKSDEQKQAREAAMQAATIVATRVPLDVVLKSLDVVRLARVAATEGLEASLSDAGVAGSCALTAAEGAALNVLINLPGIDDAGERDAIASEMKTALESIRSGVADLLREVEQRLGG